jgi:hypothetical protein
VKLSPKKIRLVLEIAFHMFLVVAVPLIYLEIATDYNKYRLPEHMIYVYIYWAIYIFATVTFYGLKKKRKKYQRPDCTKKYENL